MKKSQLLFVITAFFSFNFLSSALELNLSQDVLLEKIADYIHLEASSSDSPEEKKNRLEAETLFRKGGKHFEGVCFGLVCTWFYCQRMSDEPLTDPSKKRDDMKFFYTVIELLMKVSPTKYFSDYQKSEIDRFISYIMSFQAMSSLSLKDFQKESNSLDFMTDTHDRSLKCIAEFEYNLVEPIFVSKCIEFSQPKKLLGLVFFDQVSTLDAAGNPGKKLAGHILGCYQSDHKDSNGNRFYAYDPNEKSFIISFPSMEDCAKWAWQKIDPTFLTQENPDKITDSFRNVKFFIITFSSDDDVAYFDLDQMVNLFMPSIDSALEDNILMRENISDNRIQKICISEQKLEGFYEELYRENPQKKEIIEKIITYVFLTSCPYSDDFKGRLLRKNPKIFQGIIRYNLDALEDYIKNVEGIIKSIFGAMRVQKQTKIIPISFMQLALAHFLQNDVITERDVEILTMRIHTFLKNDLKTIDSFDSEFIEGQYSDVLEILKTLAEKIKNPSRSDLESVDFCRSELKIHYDTIERLVSAKIFYRSEHLITSLNVLTKNKFFVKKPLEEIIKSLTMMIDDFQLFVDRQTDAQKDDLDGSRKNLIKEAFDYLYWIRSIVENMIFFTQFGPVVLSKEYPVLPEKPAFLKKSVADYQAALGEWLSALESNVELSSYQTFKAIKSELYWLINKRIVTLPKINRALSVVQESIGKSKTSKSKNAQMLKGEYEKLELLLQDLKKKLEFKV